MNVRWPALSILVALTFGLTACIGPAPAVAPTIPPVRAERIPVPPSSSITLIWQPGHWTWNGAQFEWLDGEWVPRSGHGPLWQDGFWRRDGRSYLWVPAHWI